MSNALFKQTRERVALPPAPLPPLAPVRRLVRRTGTRPRYREYLSIDPQIASGTQFVGTVTLVRERVGVESYDYYEWVVDTPAVPTPAPPVVTAVPDAWDATARSGAVLMTPMAAEWVVGPGNIDLIVGLSTSLESPDLPPSPETLDPEVDAERNAALAAGLRASILHGFRVVGGAAYVHSAPPPSFGSVALDQRYPFRTVSPGTVCRVECARGIVTYLVDDVVVATGPAYVYDGQALYLRAALFGVNDLVETPALETLPASGDGGAVLGPLTGKSGAYSEGMAMLALYANGPRRMGVAATLAPLWLSAGNGSGTASIDLAPLGAWGWGIQGNDGDGAGSVGPLMAKAGKYAEGAASVGIFAFGRGAEAPPQANPLMTLDSLMDASLAPFAHRGAYGDMGMGFTFVPQYSPLRAAPTTLGLRGAAKPSRVWDARVESALGLMGAAGGTRVLDVALVARLGAGAPTIGVLVLTAQMDAGLGLDGDTTARSLADVLVRVGLGADIDVGLQGIYYAALHAAFGMGLTGVRNADDYIVWSVERGGASAAYAGFAFNSFARLGGRIFAAGDSGLYELGGADDDGTPIAAWVDLGKRNFNSTMLKGISNAYLTSSADQKLVMRVTTPEGQSYTYQARGADPAMQAQRVDFGRGLSATYLNLEIMNEGGAAFELERAEFIVNEKKRRI